MGLFSRKCKIYIQMVVTVQTLVSFSALQAAELNRAPANFVPDDDVIVVPVIVEKNIVDEFHEKHKNDFKNAKRKLRYWISQEQYAKDHGLEYSGIVHLPSAEDKETFLHRNYLRFITKDVEKSANAGVKNTLENWTTDDEIDSIQAVEMHERVIVKAKKSKGQNEIKKSRTVKVGKDKFKFGFQARPEIGMLKFTVKSKYFNARGWVGINGNQEIKVERTIASTNTRMMMNYYIDQARILAAADQRLTRHWSLRYTHNKKIDEFSEYLKPGSSEDNIVQLRFGMGF